MITLKNVVSGFRRALLGENFNTVSNYINSNLLHRVPTVAGENKMEAAIDMDGNNILNVGDITFEGGNNFVTKEYVDAQDARVASEVDLRTRVIDMGGNRLRGVTTIAASTSGGGHLVIEANGNLEIDTNSLTIPDPVNYNHAATKQYVDDSIVPTGVTTITSLGGVEGGNISTIMQNWIDANEDSGERLTFFINLEECDIGGVLIPAAMKLTVKGFGSYTTSSEKSTNLSIDRAGGFAIGFKYGILGDKVSTLRIEDLGISGYTGASAGQKAFLVDLFEATNIGTHVSLSNIRADWCESFLELEGNIAFSFDIEDITAINCRNFIKISGTAETNHYADAVKIRRVKFQGDTFLDIPVGWFANAKATLLVEDSDISLTKYFIFNARPFNSIVIKNNRIESVGELTNWLILSTIFTTPDTLRWINNDIRSTGAVIVPWIGELFGPSIWEDNRFDCPNTENANPWLINSDNAGSRSTNTRLWANHDDATYTTAGLTKGLIRENRLGQWLPEAYSLKDLGASSTEIIPDNREAAISIPSIETNTSLAFYIKIPEGATGGSVRVISSLSDGSKQSDMAGSMTMSVRGASDPYTDYPSASVGESFSEWPLVAGSGVHSFPTDVYTTSIFSSGSSGRNIDGTYLAVVCTFFGATTNLGGSNDIDELPKIQAIVSWI